jgi:hypothetical protein
MGRPAAIAARKVRPGRSRSKCSARNDYAGLIAEH